MFTPRPLLPLRRYRRCSLHSVHTKTTRCDTDSCGIPLKPTWSVFGLLSSYPKPSITTETLNRLHELSALVPPEGGTEEADGLKTELEQLVKLVEAVKLVEVNRSEESSIPDGRIWAEGTGLPLNEANEVTRDGVNGQALLRHAARTSNGYYLVDADRRIT